MWKASSRFLGRWRWWAREGPGVNGGLGPAPLAPGLALARSPPPPPPPLLRAPLPAGGGVAQRPKAACICPRSDCLSALSFCFLNTDLWKISQIRRSSKSHSPQFRFEQKTPPAVECQVHSGGASGPVRPQTHSSVEPPCHLSAGHSGDFGGAEHRGPWGPRAGGSGDVGPTGHTRRHS